MPTLIPCPACKKKMSSEAPACPKCGHPLNEEQRRAALKKQADAKKGGLVLLALLAVVIAGAGLFGGESKQPPAPAQPAAVTAQPAQQAQAVPPPTAPAAPAQPSVPAQPAESAKPAEPAKAEPAKPKATFPMTVEAFIKAFNKAVNTPKKSTITLKRSPGTELPGDVLTSVQASINKKHGMVISYDNATQKVANVTMISGGDNWNAVDSSEMLLAWATIIQLFSPELKPEERGAVLKELGIIQDTVKDKGEAGRKGVRYWHSMGQGMGIWFGAEAI